MKKWILSAIVTLVLLFAYTLPMEGLEPTGKAALLVFIWAIVLWIIRPIPEFLSSILGAAVLMIIVKVPSGSVLSGFSSGGWWMVLFATMLGGAIIQTGLGKRMAYLLLEKIGTSLLRVIYATTFVNNILAPFTPSNTARGAILSGISDGICDSMGFKRGEKKGDHTLMLANMYINTTNTSMFLTATGANAISVALVAELTGHTITWSQWFMAAFVPGVPLLILFPYIVYKLFPPAPDKVKVDTGYAKQKLVEMGPMSKQEKSTLIIMILTLVCWATELIHGVGASMISFVMAIALLFPNIGAVTWKEIDNKIPWPMLIWLGFAMGFAKVINNTGGFKWLIDSFFLESALISNIGMTGFLVILVIGIVFMHLIFSGMNAMTMIMIPISIQLAAAKGFDPFAIGFIAAIACASAPFFLPFNSAPNLIFFSTGRYEVKDQLKGAFPLAFCTSLSLLFALFVWWPIIGLI